MRTIGNIVSKLVMLVALVAFAISTTGFTFYTHVCGGENVQSSILLNDDNCCADAEPEQPKQAESCCAEEVVEIPKSACDGCYSESDCCITDVSYVKLSENYLISENEIISLECTSAPIVLDLNVPKNRDIDEQFTCKSEDIPKSRPPLYRLYNQVKIDPPLI